MKISHDPWGARERVICVAIIIAIAAFFVVFVGGVHAQGNEPACPTATPRPTRTPTPTPPVTAIGLTAFNAIPVVGNGSGCALSNRIYGLECNVSDFVSGRVSVKCAAGMHLDKYPTARIFVTGETVYVWACVGMDDKLFSVWNFKVRIKKWR